MKDLFVSTLDLSIQGTYFILFVLLIRSFVKELPNRYLYALWVMAFAKLCVPFSFKVAFGPDLFSKKVIGTTDRFMVDGMISSPGIPMDEISEGSLFISGNDPALNLSPSLDPIRLLSLLWIAGLGFLILRSIYEIYILNKDLKTSKHLYENIYVSDRIDTAFVFGLRPRIYIPENLNDIEMRCILEHERVHVSRFDHLIKSFCWLILCLHWLNPFVWLAFHWLSEDMELSCDEKVLDLLGSGHKKDYSDTLLKLASKKSFFETRVAFGESSIRKRILSVLKYQKPKFISILAACALIVFAGVFFFTENNGPLINNAKDLYGFKTKYVGDNSKVENIIDRLYIPYKYSKREFRIHSSEPPYGVQVYYTIDETTLKRIRPYLESEKKMMSEEEWREIRPGADTDFFNADATILFSLVDNLEWVRFTFLCEGWGEFHHLLKREEMDEHLARESDNSFPYDLNEAGQTIENFKLLYKTLGFPYDKENARHQAMKNARTVEKITDKYLPDLLTEDLDMIDLAFSEEIGNIDEQYFGKYVPSADQEKYGNLLKLSTTFKGDKLINFTLKFYTYQTELEDLGVWKHSPGRYYHHVSGGDLSMLKDKAFNSGTEEVPSILYLNLEKAKKYQDVFSKEDPADKNTDRIFYKKLTEEEGMELANEFIHEFVDKNAVLDRKISIDDDYQDYYTDKDHKYEVHVDLSMGFVQVFRSYLDHYPFDQRSFE
ncbi:MAG: M56 family metallopeptidase [Peptostreptococcaceae bacterium]|nr:M56 family metallopeptidase [Peptostreptococcaceae bacterium]